MSWVYCDGVSQPRNARVPDPGRLDWSGKPVPLGRPSLSVDSSQPVNAQCYEFVTVYYISAMRHVAQ
jgi:hypothetical protein